MAVLKSEAMKACAALGISTAKGRLADLGDLDRLLMRNIADVGGARNEKIFLATASVGLNLVQALRVAFAALTADASEAQREAAKHAGGLPKPSGKPLDPQLQKALEKGGKKQEAGLLAKSGKFTNDVILAAMNDETNAALKALKEHAKTIGKSNPGAANAHLAKLAALMKQLEAFYGGLKDSYNNAVRHKDAKAFDANKRVFVKQLTQVRSLIPPFDEHLGLCFQEIGKSAGKGKPLMQTAGIAKKFG